MNPKNGSHANDYTNVWKVMQLKALLFLIKEHRKSCTGNCGINLYPLRDVAIELSKPLGLSEEESQLFL